VDGESAHFIARLREIEALILRCRLEFGLRGAGTAASGVPEDEVRSVTSELRNARHPTPGRRA
jgi:hypothetical protein